MDPVHREVLDVNHNYLVERVCAAHVLPRLVRDDIVNDDDVKQLQRTEGQGPRAVNRLMLLTLRRRGSCAYAALHRALRDAGLDDVCDTLLDTELALREGLAADRIGSMLSGTRKARFICFSIFFSY
ncbi:hypothetical protein C0Q70_13338 [Pomacea canaliculata]|uniref:CARD domain-containing protein n=1 Tax=Pomacea canaliculata TaxID=400727 RepID=A0A2T7NWY4_POMCA|nr:hypothetical protein C0Q70_13338 [Pomacea canaliculata]